jgi:hypothetical protein
MSKYELSITKDYVPDWGVVEAVRELFQNAIDQQTTVEGNDMYFSYDADNQTLKIGNKLSVLNPRTLLLGSSTKRGDDSTIGEKGEGYKIATLVLTRLNKKVVFYNYGAREVWLPRFVKSRRYGTEILTFFVDKKFPWTTVPDNNLTITIEGITQEEYESIKISNLHLTKPEDYITTIKGRILLDKQFAGKVFVNGLYVTQYEPYTYGYDFKPAVIQLDRDRKLVSDFNLQWLSSRMWEEKADERMASLAAKMVEDNSADIKYVTSGWLESSNSNIKDIADKVHTSFTAEHGVNAVPVISNVEMAGLSPKYTPIIVSSTYKEVMMKSSMYKEPEKEVQISFEDQVADWLDKWKNKMHPTAAEELRELLNQHKPKEEEDNGESIPF